MDIVQPPPAESTVPILRDTAAAAEFLCIGKSTFQAGVKSGKYPKPIYVSQRRPAWTESSLVDYIKSLSL